MRPDTTRPTYDALGRPTRASVQPKQKQATGARALLPRRGLGLGKTGGKDRAVFRHAFDQKPAAMAVKNMFHQG
jgi:hypothetical protein